jgi:hypothetical protein
METGLGEELRVVVERLLERYGEETTVGNSDNNSGAADGRLQGTTTAQGVPGRPRLLFCGVVAGPLAHGLLLPDEPPPSPVRSAPRFVLFIYFIYFCLVIHFSYERVRVCARGGQVEVYAVCVVPTESLLTIEAIEVNIKEWTLTHKQVLHHTHDFPWKRREITQCFHHHLTLWCMIARAGGLLDPRRRSGQVLPSGPQR